MEEQYNTTLNDEQVKYRERLLILFSQMLWWYSSLSKSEKRRYRYYLEAIIANELNQELYESNLKLLIILAKKIQSMSQPSHSRNIIGLVLDKTTDGERYGKKQRFASRQYSGKGIIRTHGWVAVMAVIGRDHDSLMLPIGMILCEPNKRKGEWKYGKERLQKVLEGIKQHNIKSQLYRVIGDGKYFTQQFMNWLDMNGVTYVFKAGGKLKEELYDPSTGCYYEGELSDLPKSIPKKRKSSHKGASKYTNYSNYTRFKSLIRDLIYFDISFQKKHSHWKSNRRVLVTNNLSATNQWIAYAYFQRWRIECFFRYLKQSCNWGCIV